MAGGKKCKLCCCLCRPLVTQLIRQARSLIRTIISFYTELLSSSFLLWGLWVRYGVAFLLWKATFQGLPTSELFSEHLKIRGSKPQEFCFQKEKTNLALGSRWIGPSGKKKRVNYTVSLRSNNRSVGTRQLGRNSLWNWWRGTERNYTGLCAS